MTDRGGLGHGRRPRTSPIARSQAAGATHDVEVTAVRSDRVGRRADVVAVEAPLTIRLEGDDGSRTLATTMRTPGADLDLAAGFCFSEGLLERPEDLLDVSWCRDTLPEAEGDVVTVRRRGPLPDLGHLQRHGTVTSACGVCGRTEVARVTSDAPPPDLSLDAAVLGGLPAALAAGQDTFAATGGLHAAGRADVGGALLDVREDVGRHNALDALIGAGVRRAEVPWTDQVLVLSGRASFELLAKAARVRTPIVAAVGAPSSLAIDVAQAAGITLVGFLREDRANVYTNPQRITAGR